MTFAINATAEHIGRRRGHEVGIADVSSIKMSRPVFEAQLATHDVGFGHAPRNCVCVTDLKVGLALLLSDATTSILEWVNIELNEVHYQLLFIVHMLRLSSKSSIP